MQAAFLRQRADQIAREVSQASSELNRLLHEFRAVENRQRQFQENHDLAVSAGDQERITSTAAEIVRIEAEKEKTQGKIASILKNIPAYKRDYELASAAVVNRMKELSEEIAKLTDETNSLQRTSNLMSNTVGPKINHLISVAKQ